MEDRRSVSDSTTPQRNSVFSGLFFALLGVIVPFCVSKLRSSKNKTKSSTVQAENRGNDEIIMRNSRFSDLIEVPWEGATTITALFEQSCEKHAQRRCLGTRTLLSRELVESSDGKKLEKLHLGEYEWRTYAETFQCASDFASGLMKLGHKPEHRVAILSETRAEWFISFQGCLRQNLTVVTVYASLGEDAIIHSLNETGTTTLICDSQQTTKLGALIPRLETVENVIYFEDDLTPSGFSFSAKFKVISFSDVVKLGKVNSTPAKLPEKDDVAVIMYTSGSTGLPKGVLITHRSFIATLSGLLLMLPKLRNEIYLAYLPLAHVFELVAETIAFALGSAIGYGSALTLIGSSSKIKHGTKGDASELKPTFITSVPAVLDRVRDGVLKKVDAKGGLTRKLFHLAYKRRLAAVEGRWFGAAWGLERMLWDFIVFKKIRALLGGRVWYVLCGGAPLSGDAQMFIQICLGAHVAAGYGLTETCAGATCAEEDDSSVGRVGPPVPSCWIKLRSWEEGGYRVSDKPMPRGEIAVGGFGVTGGYLNNEAKSNEVYNVDHSGIRWFYTGDIGRFHPDGVLEIIDRKKDIIKLQHGEYVSLGQIESVLRSNRCIDNAMVHADPLHSYCVALIVPSRDILQDWARSAGLGFDSFEGLCSSTEAVREVKWRVLEAGRVAKLNKYEIPAKVRLLPDPWTPESGLVTASLKLKREEIKRRFKDELKALYS